VPEALRQAVYINSLAHSSIGTRSSHLKVGLPLLVGIWFQELFQRAPALLFTFPSRYLFTIGQIVYLALGVSSPRFPRTIHVPRYSGICAKKCLKFRIQDYHHLWFSFPANPTTPNLQQVTYSVWASSFSLAATNEILISFYSSRY
jgi:hypothetical protein